MRSQQGCQERAARIVAVLRPRAAYTHLPSTRVAPGGERREFRKDQRLVRPLARTAREGLGSQPRASRLLFRRSLTYGPAAPTTAYANSRRPQPPHEWTPGPGDCGASGTGPPVVTRLPQNHVTRTFACCGETIRHDGANRPVHCVICGTPTYQPGDQSGRAASPPAAVMLVAVGRNLSDPSS